MLVAADAVHEEAMSQMGDDSQNEAQSGRTCKVEVEDWMHVSTKCSTDLAGNEDGHLESKVW